MNITIVTPWRDHRELERDYFNAIRCEQAELVIVDDGSETPLPNAWRIEPSGFAAACNAGLSLVNTEAVLFLNNDVALGRRGWLEPIRAALEPGVVVGPVQAGAWGSVDGVSLPWVDGWCLAGMTDDLRELGGWDETFDEPSYYGDNDLSLRARAAGMVLRDVRPALTHKRNVTAGPATDPSVLAASERNRALFTERARDLIGVAA